MMTDTPPLTGDVIPGFAPVRDHLLSTLESGENLGAGLCILIDGEPVVDLRAGWRDRRKETAFGDALLCIYSCGKAVTAALIAKAVEDGLLDYDQPISELWPAFGAHGKEAITLGDGLSHRTGLSAFPEPIDPALWVDWHGLCAALADLEPQFPPSGQSGYQPQSYGHVVGEPYRLATRRTIGEALAETGVDVFCGLPAAAQARTAAMVKPPSAPNLGELTPLKKAAFLSPWSSPSTVDRATWMAAEIPAANMHASARGLAEIMRAFADDGAERPVPLSKSGRDAALAERHCGDDLVLPFEVSWAAGVMRNHDGKLGPSPTAVGHYGFGGSFVIADPAHRLACAFIPNKMTPDLVGGARASALQQVIYDCL